MTDTRRLEDPRWEKEFKKLTRRTLQWAGHDERIGKNGGGGY